MRGQTETGGKKARAHSQASAQSRFDLLKTLGLSGAEIEERKRFLELGDEASRRLQRLKDPVRTGQQRFIAALYEQLSGFAAVSPLIADAEVQQRLQGFMQRYFSGLTDGVYDHAYVEERVRVGVIHQKIGLDLKWYVGAYRKFLSEMIDLIVSGEYRGDDPILDLQALLKIVFFDVGLALDTYIFLESERLRAAERRAHERHDPQLDELGHRDGIVGDVRKLLLANLGHPTGLERIAAQLNLSPRTLRRHLQNVGTTFRGIADELRMQIAVKYLRETAMTNEDIAGLLGFSDAANFRRSFRRWTKATPSEFREPAKTTG